MKFSSEDTKKYSLIESEDEDKCGTCSEPTKFIEYCYEVRCCSTECLAKLDKKYNDWLINHEEECKNEKK